MLEYGDSKDGYYSNDKKYTSGGWIVFCNNGDSLIESREKCCQAFCETKGLAQICLGAAGKVRSRPCPSARVIMELSDIITLHDCIGIQSKDCEGL
jgi:hypothetical protein